MRHHLNQGTAALMEEAARILSQSLAENGGRRGSPAAASMCQERRRRSLMTCHRFSLYDRPRHAPPKDSGAFVPSSSSRLEDDRNLTDGARRCARKLLELGYFDARETRELSVTVGGLAKRLGRCRRTVQRYLGLLEREGYVQIEVEVNRKSRMTTGLIVQLLAPLFPRHQRRAWPEKRRNPDATRESQIQSLRLKEKGLSARVARESWALRCMNGVWRSLMKTNPVSRSPLALVT